MRLTVEQAVSDRAVKKDDLETVVNKEILPLTRQARKGLNARGIERPDPVDSDGAGTYSTLWTSAALPNDCMQTIEAHVQGAGATVRARYTLTQAVTSIGGTVAAAGATGYDDYESAAACDARITVDTVNRVVTVDARDAATEAMRWTCVVYTAEGLKAE